MNDAAVETGRSTLLRLLAISIALVVGVALLGAAMAAIFGPADQLSPATEPTAELRNDKPLNTFAGIAPVAWLVEQIGGKYVRVKVLVPARSDPHIFEPTPRQVIELGKARLFFRVGMPFEDRLLEHIAGGPAQFTVIDTAAGIESPHHHDHHSEEEGHHDDPHIWLSPPLLEKMADNVANALCQADPRHEKFYQDRLEKLHAKIKAHDGRIRESLKPYAGQAFYVFHPAFGCFAARYGLRQESVEVEGKLPTPRQVFDLITKARRDHVKIIFLQPQFDEQVAESIAQAIGGTVVQMDDLAPDVVANLDEVARKIAASRENVSGTLRVPVEGGTRSVPDTFETTHD